MQTTDLTNKEDDLNIVYGPCKDYIKDEISELTLASVKYMFSDLTDIRKFYLRLGFHLVEFYNMCGYMDFGFNTLYDFCEANLGLDKGAVSRCMNVYWEFNAKNDVKRIGNYESHGSAMDLSERWKDYSYTQLCEMLPLTEDQRKKVTPDMTIKQIREYKKSLREKEHKEKEFHKNLDFLSEIIKKSKDPVASTQPEDLEGDPVASTQLFDFDEYESKKGIVRYNYVKKCNSIEGHHFKQLYIFDDRGKEIVFDEQCDILLEDDNEIVLRMHGDFKSLEWDDD